MTILFWTGVFASKITDEGFTKRDIRLFGVGAVMTTFVFLGFVAFLAGLLQPIMTDRLMKLLNVVVGIVLVGFSVRLFIKKSNKSIISEKPITKA